MPRFAHHDGFKIRFQNGLPYLDDQVRLFPPQETSTSFDSIDLMLYRPIGTEAIKPSSGSPVHNQFLVRPLMDLLRRLLPKS